MRLSAVFSGMFATGLAFDAASIPGFPVGPPQVSHTKLAGNALY
jgi:hypothetical protein